MLTRVKATCFVARVHFQPDSSAGPGCHHHSRSHQSNKQLGAAHSPFPRAPTPAGLPPQGTARKTSRLENTCFAVWYFLVKTGSVPLFDFRCNMNSRASTPCHGSGWELKSQPDYFHIVAMSNHRHRNKWTRHCCYQGHRPP